MNERRTAFDYAMARAEVAASEAELAAIAYRQWMAAWRARNGHLGAFDPDTGLPLAELEGAQP